MSFFVELMEYADRMAHKWDVIGIQLGRADMVGDLRDRSMPSSTKLTRVFESWVESPTDDLPAEWSTIVKVLKTPAINLTALARKIEEEKILPQPPKETESPPNPDGFDPPSSSAPFDSDEFNHPPSDAGLQGVVKMLPDSWNVLAISLGVPLADVTAFSKKDSGGLLALQYWRDGKSGEGYDITWTFLLKEVSKNIGPNVADNLRKEAMKNHPSWWKTGAVTGDKVEKILPHPPKEKERPPNPDGFDPPSISAPFDSDEFNHPPSDAGLVGVVDMLPDRWNELAISLGVPIADITAFSKKDSGGLLALQYWRDGKSGYDTTWTFLLKEVSKNNGSNVADDLKKEAVKNYPSWWRLGDVTGDEVEKILPHPPKETERPPNPDRFDPPSSSAPFDSDEFNHPPSDAGLVGVVNMLPDTWNALAISLGVPFADVTAFSRENLGGLLALQYWRDGKSGEGYDTTWTFLLKKVSKNDGSIVADDLRKEAVKNHPSWWKTGDVTGDKVEKILPHPPKETERPPNPDGFDPPSISAPFDPKKFNRPPSNAGLLGVVEKLGADWYDLAISLGVPRVHVKGSKENSDKVDALTYWRDGKSGKGYDTTWTFLLEKVSENIGPTVADDLKEKAMKNYPSWWKLGDITGDEVTNMTGKVEQPGKDPKMADEGADSYLDRVPSDEGLCKVLQEFPYWETYAIPLGLTSEQVDYFYRMKRGDNGVLALTHWRDGHCGEDHPATWRFLLKVIGDSIGPVPAGDLEKKVLNNSNWTLPDTVPPGDCHCFTGMKPSPPTNMTGKVEQPGKDPKVEAEEVDSFLDRAPSDEGLYKVLQEHPNWEMYAVPLGLKPLQVEHFYSMKRRDKGVLALRHWRDGHCGEESPGSWRFLLKVIGDSIGPVPAGDLGKKVRTNSNWTLPDTVPPGDCHCFTRPEKILPQPPKETESPPNPDGFDPPSISAPFDSDEFNHPPSDAGLQGVVNMLPDSWNVLAFSLGVPFTDVTAFSKKDLGGLLALQYWRDGKSGAGYATTWTFLLKKVSENIGPVVAEDLKEEAVKNHPSWWKTGDVTGDKVTNMAGKVEQPGKDPKMETEEVNDFLDRAPSNEGLHNVLQKHPNWEDYAIPLGLTPEQVDYFYSMKRGDNGVALRHWRDGHCGEDYPGTWRFLLKVIEDSTGPVPAGDLEKEVFHNRNWTLPNTVPPVDCHCFTVVNLSPPGSDGMSKSHRNMDTTARETVESQADREMEAEELVDFLDMRPSDIGLNGILEICPRWEQYAILLGLSIEQVKYYHDTQEAFRGLLALKHWRDGRCGSSYPGTWRFLLDVMKDVTGPVIADALRAKVSATKTWTLRGQADEATGVKLECISKLKEFYLKHSVIQDDLLEMNSELQYIPLSYVKVKKETDEKEKERPRGSEPVEYDDIISSVVGGPKHVLLQGSPGTGKSTTLRKICHDFALGNLPPEIKAVVHVVLGELEEGSKPTMEDLMQTCISEEQSNLIEEITSFAREHNGEGTLFLFDGFDELARDLQKKSLVTDILNCKAYPWSSYIITSRPSATARLPPQAAKQMDCVETQGFTEDKMKQFIQQWFQTRPDTGKKVIEIIIANSKLCDMCRNPLTVLIVCTIASEEQMLPDRIMVLLKSMLCLLGNSYMKKKGQDPSIEEWEDLEEQCSSFKQLTDLALHGFLKGQYVFTDRDSSLPHRPSTLDHMGLFRVTSQRKGGAIVILYRFFHLIVQEFLSAYALSLKSSEDQTAFWGEHLVKGPIIETGDRSKDCDLSLYADRRFETIFQFYAGLTSLRDGSIQQLLFDTVDTDKGLVLGDDNPVTSERSAVVYESQNEEIAKQLFSHYNPSLTIWSCKQQQQWMWCLQHSSFSSLSLNDVGGESLEVIKQVFDTSKDRLEEVHWTTSEHGGEFVLEAIAKCTKLKALVLKGKRNQFSSRFFLNVLTRSTSLQSLFLRRVQLLDMDAETIVGDISGAIVHLIRGNLSDVTLEECCDKLTRGVVEGVKGLDHKCKLTISEDRALKFQENLEDVLKTSASVTLKITKCTTIGPPEVGKTHLKCLLLNQEWDPNTGRTDVIRAPEWVEHYIEDSSKWKLFTCDERMQAICRNIMNKKYQEEIQEEEKENNQEKNNDQEKNNAQEKNNNQEKNDDQEEESDHQKKDGQKVKEKSAQEHHIEPSLPQLNKEEKVDSSKQADENIIEDSSIHALDTSLGRILEGDHLSDSELEGHILGEKRLLYFVDTGGQEYYHDIHPILITSPSVYFVVFDLRECLKEGGRAEFFREELIQRPLRSIHAFGTKQVRQSKFLKIHPSDPKIFIIGTHLDRVREAGREEEIESISSDVQSELLTKPYNRFLQPDPRNLTFWPIDNTLAGKPLDEDSEDLKYICDLKSEAVQGVYDAEVTVPLSWLILEQAILKTVPKADFFPYLQLLKLCSEWKLVHSEEEFQTMLYIFHILGLFFFPPILKDAPLRDEVVYTNPDFLYRMTSQLLEECRFRKKPIANKTCPRPGIIQDYRKLLSEIGVKKNIGESFLNMLQDLKIIVKIKSLSEDLILFPAALPATDQVSSSEAPSSPGPLLLSFTSSRLLKVCYVPTGFFRLLIADLAANSDWTLDLDKLFHNFVMFKVKVQYGKGVLSLLERVSFIEVTFTPSIDSPPLFPSHNAIYQKLKERVLSLWSNVYGQKDESSEQWVHWGFPCETHPKERHTHIAEFVGDKDDYIASCLHPMGSRIQSVRKEQILWLFKVDNRPQQF